MGSVTVIRDPAVGNSCTIAPLPTGVPAPVAPPVNQVQPAAQPQAKTAKPAGPPVAPPRPPDAEPVSAARMLVATASETNSPPSIDSTQSRTASNAGMAATTDPKPTRLATLKTGRTEALAPASTVSRNAVNRR